MLAQREEQLICIRTIFCTEALMILLREKASPAVSESLAVLYMSSRTQHTVHAALLCLFINRGLVHWCIKKSAMWQNRIEHISVSITAVLLSGLHIFYHIPNTHHVAVSNCKYADMPQFVLHPTASYPEMRAKYRNIRQDNRTLWRYVADLIKFQRFPIRPQRSKFMNNCSKAISSILNGRALMNVPFFYKCSRVVRVQITFWIYISLFMAEKDELASSDGSNNWTAYLRATITGSPPP